MNTLDYRAPEPRQPWLRSISERIGIPVFISFCCGAVAVVLGAASCVLIGVSVGLSPIGLFGGVLLMVCWLASAIGTVAAIVGLFGRHRGPALAGILVCIVAAVVATAVAASLDRPIGGAPGGF